MTFPRILFALGALAVLWLAYDTYGASGVAVAVSGIVMWLLLHFTRVMHVLKRAADRPLGYVSSAVMLNAKLKPKATLLWVTGLTGALGEQLSPKDQQPEVFRWTDTGGSHVTCEFDNGKLVKWALYRPPVADSPADGESRPTAH
jgi:hypothetical protein